MIVHDIGVEINIRTHAPEPCHFLTAVRNRVITRTACPLAYIAHSSAAIYVTMIESMLLAVYHFIVLPFVYWILDLEL